MRASALGYLTIDRNLGLEGLRQASAELAAVGVIVSADDMRATLARVGAYQNPVTREWAIPGAAAPSFGFDGLQDAVMDRTGLRGAALFRGWSAVKGRLRLRWAAGNTSRPADTTVARWALSV